MIGAIVAGGGSTRFGGAPKGLARVAGKRIVDRVAGALSAVASEIILVTNAADAQAWGTGLAIVRDARPERGSIVGLHTALARARDVAIVVAWDMPFVTPALLRLIVARGVREPHATIPESARGLEPFCAMYGVACLPFVESALDAGDLRMSSALGRLPSMTRVLPRDVEQVGEPAKLFFNVNTAADLAAAEQMSRAADGSRLG